MTFLDAALPVVVLIGLGAGAFMVARSPSFYIQLGRELLAVAVPAVWAVISKRMTPQQEADFHQATRRAQEWDAFRKKPRDR